MNLIKRFGISNPSSTYILNTATAFRSGSYKYVSSTGEVFDFGSSQHGDLGATVAAILLESEARDMVLDLDPTHGSLVRLLHIFHQCMLHVFHPRMMCVFSSTHIAYFSSPSSNQF